MRSQNYTRDPRRQAMPSGTRAFLHVFLFSKIVATTPKTQNTAATKTNQKGKRKNKVRQFSPFKRKKKYVL